MRMLKEVREGMLIKNTVSGTIFKVVRYVYDFNRLELITIKPGKSFLHVGDIYWFHRDSSVLEEVDYYIEKIV